jgi:hypothetical protein
MKIITLFLTAMLFSIVTYTQVFPTLSNGATDTWYYIQFERPGGDNNGVIQDMGDGVKLLTKQARENTDSQLWKITGSVGNYIITNKLGGVIDHNDNAAISVYPNPFKNYFHFNVKNTSSNEASLKVYSIEGKLVKSDSLSLNKGNFTVDTSGLSKGLYIVEIETAEGKSKFKMIKQ